MSRALSLNLALVFAFGCSPERHVTVVEPKAHEQNEEPHPGERGDEHVDEHGAPDVVRLSTRDRDEFGIEVETAGPGKLLQLVDLPGEIVLNADRLAHVSPRLSGIVREVRKNLGDDVVDGDVLAVPESREPLFRGWNRSLFCQAAGR